MGVSLEKMQVTPIGYWIATLAQHIEPRGSLGVETETLVENSLLLSTETAMSMVDWMVAVYERALFRSQL